MVAGDKRPVSHNGNPHNWGTKAAVLPSPIWFVNVEVLSVSHGPKNLPAIDRSYYLREIGQPPFKAIDTSGHHHTLHK